MMSRNDAYGPCPCGSGLKYKWCCQKVEGDIERIYRLIHSGQWEGARNAVEQSLKREPKNPSLMQWKVNVLLHFEAQDEALVVLKSFRERHPSNAFANNHLILLYVSKESSPVLIAALQDAFEQIEPEDRAGLTGALYWSGRRLFGDRRQVVGLKLITLAAVYADEDDAQGPTAQEVLEGLMTDYGLAPWLKSDFHPMAMPEGLDDERAKAFAKGVADYDAQRWRRSARTFDQLAARADLPEAIWNLAISHLLLADHPRCESALKRYQATLDPASTEAVDVEVLRQEIHSRTDAELIETVSQAWPIRNRGALLDVLAREDLVVPIPTNKVPQPDPEEPESVVLLLLSNPPIKTRREVGQDWRRMPRVLAKIFVEPNEVRLEAADDGTLDTISERFRSLVGSTVSPAHPRTRTIVKLPRDDRLFDEKWYPSSMEDGSHPLVTVIPLRARYWREVWPDRPLDALQGKTPRQVAQLDDLRARAALRAALLRVEFQQLVPLDRLPELRRDLGVPPEPEIDPGSVVDVAGLSKIVRWRLEDLDPARLADPNLLSEYVSQIFGFGLERPILRVLDPLLEKSEELCDTMYLPAIVSSVVFRLRGLGEIDRALQILAKARAHIPDRVSERWNLSYDLIDIRIKMAHTNYEAWIPDLFVLNERHWQNPVTKQLYLRFLVEARLVELYPDPEKNGTYMLDTSLLERLFVRFGPKIRTAAGEIGTAAGKIWTPGDPGREGSESKFWTPGTAPEAAVEAKKPKLIFPSM